MTVMPVGYANSEQHTHPLHTARTKKHKCININIPEVFTGDIPTVCSSIGTDSCTSLGCSLFLSSGDLILESVCSSPCAARRCPHNPEIHNDREVNLVPD